MKVTRATPGAKRRRCRGVGFCSSKILVVCHTRDSQVEEGEKAKGWFPREHSGVFVANQSHARLPGRREG